MSESCKQIIAILEKKFPVSLAEDYDNVGLLLGDPEANINKIMVCLDINESVVNYAIKNKIDLIISHHPVIFRPLKRIVRDNYIDNLIYKLIGANIAVYALHTNFDNADEGMNDVLADLIGLSDVRKLGNEKGTGRYGKLEAGMTLEQLCFDLKPVFNIESIRLIGDPNTIVRQVAVVGGAGSDFINDAADAGCDVMITGDIKYHEAVEALYSGICVIDAGHFNTESSVMPYLSEIISEMTGIDVVCPSFATDPFTVV